MTEAKSSYGGEWRHGWLAVLAASLGGGAATTHFFTMGILLGPITADTGWTNAQVMAGLLICSIIAVPGAPFVGWLVDRMGLRPVVLTGLPLLFLSFGVTGALATSYTGWIVAWSLIALCSILVKANVWILWVAREFDAARGMAFAVVMSGVGVFAIVLPPLTHASIVTFGWRLTFPAVALAMALASIPACYYALSKGAARLPGKGEAARPEKAAPAEPLAGIEIKQALRTPAFWQLLLGSLLAGWGIMSLQVFIAPMMAEKGLDGATVAILAGALGAGATVGRLVTGVLLDRYSAKLVGTISMLVPAGACLVYLYAPIDLPTAALIAVLFGVSIGAEGDVMAYLSSRHFGLRNFGTIFGFMAGAVALGAGAGPFTIALLRDYAGEYQTVAMALMAAMLATALLIGTLGKYPETIPQPD